MASFTTHVLLLLYFFIGIKKVTPFCPLHRSFQETASSSSALASWNLSSNRRAYLIRVIGTCPTILTTFVPIITNAVDQTQDTIDDLAMPDVANIVSSNEDAAVSHEEKTDSQDALIRHFLVSFDFFRTISNGSQFSISSFNF